MIGFFALLVIQACKKDQQLIDGKKPEERIAEKVVKYKNELINSSTGWVATLTTNGIKGNYSFYMKFSDKNRVTMLADYNDTDAKVPQESAYSLKEVMSPTLIFDTYNLLHYLQDPNPNSFGGDGGIGYGSDVEFEIRALIGDTLKLIGKKRKVELILVKATADQEAVYTGGSFAQTFTDIGAYLKTNTYLFILDEKDQTKKIQVSINANVKGRKVSLVAVENNVVTSIEQPFSFSTTGISIAPLTYSGRTFVGFEWDKINKKLFILTSKGEKIEVLISVTPIIPLHLLIATSYKKITVPGQTTYPGWGSDFVTRRAAAAILPFSLKLETMNFEFNNNTKKIVLTVGIPQGTTKFNAFYGYDYTKTTTGIYKFTKDQSYVDPNGNAALIEKSMVPLLAERLETDTFTLDYFVHPTTKAVLAQFKSVEHPDFTFTGTL